MKAIIIEDESLIAKDLQTKINAVDRNIDIIAILPSLKTSKKWFMNNPEPDLIFMDIQLSDGISFDIFDSYKLICPIVFTTAYDEYAMRAFKVNGIDYLLKPVDEIQLKNAIDKCRAIVESKSAYPKEIDALKMDMAKPVLSLTRFKEKFIVHFRGQWIPIDVKNIAFFLRDALNYIYMFDGQYYPIDFTSLEEVEEVVDSTLFFRANRQFIIHINAIESVKPQLNQKLSITLKAPNQKFTVDISREKAPTFKKWMNR